MLNRGECHGKSGIFPCNFVEIVEDLLTESITTPAVAPELQAVHTCTQESVFAQQPAQYCYPEDSVTSAHSRVSETCRSSIPDFSSYLPPVDSHESLNPLSSVSDNNNTTALSNPNQLSAIDSTVGSSHQLASISYNIPTSSTLDSSSQSDHPAQLSKISTAWKESTDDNNDIFEDDYFKLNMPGLYQEKVDVISCGIDLVPDVSIEDTPLQPKSSLLRNSSRNSITRKVDEHFDRRKPLRPSMSSNTSRGIVNYNRFV